MPAAKIVFATLLLSLAASSRMHGAVLAGRLENQAIAWSWRVTGGQLQPVQVEDKINAGTVSLAGACFQVVLGDGTILNSSGFALVSAPRIERLEDEPDSPVLSRHSAGRQLVAEYAAPDQNLAAEWRVILRDDSAWVREELTLHTVNKDVSIRKIILFNEKVSGAQPVGTVDGSPVVAGNFFFGYEQPMAQNTVDSNAVVQCSCLRNAILQAGETLSQSCVIGVVPAGQLRRGFLNYIEHERAHPYRPFLHYNSWYDIAWIDRKFNETESLDVIRQFGDELVNARGVKMDSFLFDDGWDDDRTLWQFHSGFPNGFAPLKTAAEKYHADIGVWLSPFGGYLETKARRLHYAAQFGYETNQNGFSLAGPKYFQCFHDICLRMIRQYGVNQFKFDGLAAGGKAAADGLTLDGDAMLRLVADLRAARPDIYINQTTGTWPSPFWLLSVDSTWRGGMDHSFAGDGSWCQRWMTYRDAQTYKNVVRRAPLYPLNSLMLHGIIYATNATHLNSMSDGDFASQVRAFFGNGTQLQELYLTPRLLDQQNWDDLAEAATWSRSNASTLVDTHWVGGDPAKGQVYGWASWSPRQAILVLRNPGSQPASFTADLGTLFELPAAAAFKKFRLYSPWKADLGRPALVVHAGTPFTFQLQPFEILTLEAR